ncbi:MAG: hypothetical protein AAF568_00240 [Pseudomonadota bacterium]
MALLFAASISSASAADTLDDLLGRVAGCELVTPFCEAMQLSRADMFQSASIDPARTAHWVLLSAEVALSGTGTCEDSGEQPVAGPILPTETRRFVLRGTRDFCKIQDLGVRE